MRFRDAGLVMWLITAATSCAQPRPSYPREDEARRLVARWVTEYNRRQSAEVIDEFLAPGYVWHLAGSNVVGREAVKQWFARFFAENVDVRLTPEDVIVAGNTVVVRWTISGATRATGVPWQTAAITIDRVSATQWLEGWELGSERPWVPASPPDTARTQ